MLVQSFAHFVQFLDLKKRNGASEVAASPAVAAKRVRRSAKPEACDHLQGMTVISFYIDNFKSLIDFRPPEPHQLGSFYLSGWVERSG